MNKGDKVYYAQIMPTIGLYEVLELKIRTVHEDFFVGIEHREKRAYLFSYSAIDKCIFYTWDEALNKVLDAEQYAKEVSNEKYYEEF